MAKKLPDRVAFKPIDTLLGTNQADIMDIATDDLFPFKNHPFKVNDDDKMAELVESIKTNGILTPVIVRKRKGSGFEIISGHRRKYAAEKLKIKSIPAIIRDLSDDEAIITMVDSNLQREEILPSEKAFAYKLKMDALSHQGKTSRQVGDKSVDIVSSETGDSARQVHRYIRLTELIPELLRYVDLNKLKFNPAVELSYLNEEEQEILLKEIESLKVFPSLVQAEQIKKLSLENNCTQKSIHSVLFVIKPEERKIVLNKTNVDKYFPPEYDKKEIEKIIFKLLDDWKKTL